MIVDCHTHLLPDRLGRAIRKFFTDMGAPEMIYPLDHRTVLDRHLADGIDTVWNLPYAHKPEMASTLNDSMIEVSAALADHAVDVVPGCTVHPADIAPAAELHRAVDNGAKVLKLHCSVGDYQPDDPRLAPVLDAAGERHVPVVIHAGHSPTGFTATEELAPIARAAAAHPDTIIVVAHFGHEAFAHAAELMERHPNLNADLTPVVASPVPLTAEIAERFADRITFGTDAPNTGHTAGALLGYLRDLDLTDTTMDKILSGNARGLIA